jgi:hypothetical protein
MLLDFGDKGLEISFFLNGVDLGVAFSDLQKNVYYPCVILLYEGTIVKITNDIPLPNY